jgi:hypothetical protein
METVGYRMATLSMKMSLLLLLLRIACHYESHLATCCMVTVGSLQETWKRILDDAAAAAADNDEEFEDDDRFHGIRPHYHLFPPH